MKKKDWYFIIFAFLIWRFGLFVLLTLVAKFVPLETNFLGGSMGSTIFRSPSTDTGTGNTLSSRFFHF